VKELTNKNKVVDNKRKLVQIDKGYFNNKITQIGIYSTVDILWNIFGKNLLLFKFRSSSHNNRTLNILYA